MTDSGRSSEALQAEVEALRARVAELELAEAEWKRPGESPRGSLDEMPSKSMSSGNEQIHVSGIDIEWNSKRGTCTFETLPVAMMWIDTTLAGLMSGVQSMVGPQRFELALQSEGRKSVEADWEVISQYSDFREGFEAIANIAAVAGWGDWKLVSLNEKKKTCRFRVRNSWEGRYQQALGVGWGSAMLAGKLAGYCSRLFETNCWAEQTAFIAAGGKFDEFVVSPSERSIENEIENLLATDEATRADMAVALRRLQTEVEERKRVEESLRESEETLKASEVRFRSLIEETTDAVFCYEFDRPIPIDLPVEKQVRLMQDCTLVECNDVCARSYGDYRPKDVVGRRLTDLFRAVPGSLDTLFRTMVEGDYHIVDGEGVEEMPDGTRRYFLNNGHGVVEDGKLLSVWGTFRDITERKAAELELRKLSRAIEQSPASVVITDPDGTIEYVNPKFTQITGYSMEEAIGENPRILETGHTSLEEYEKMWNTITSGNEWRGEFLNKKKNGDLYWELASISPVKDESGHITHFVAVKEDITERKQVEELLRVLWSAAGQSPNAIAILDSNGVVEFANPKLLEAYQIKIDDVVGKNWRSFLSMRSSLREHLPDIRSTVLERGVTWTREVTDVSKGGEMIWREASLSPVQGTSSEVTHILYQSVDITERKQAEQALRESEERFRRLSEASFEGIVISDKGEIIDANGRVAEMLGCEHADLIGAQVMDFVAPESRDLVSERIQSEYDNPYDHIAIKKDGSRFPVEVYGQDMPYHGRTVRVTALRDITERKRAEEALRESERKYRLLFENMTAGFALHEMIYDEQGQPADYRYLEINPAFEKLTGVPVSTLLGKTVKEVLPNTEQYWIDVSGKVAQTGEPIAYQNYSRELGRYYDTWLFSTDKDQFAVVFTDVTERVQAEEALRHSERNLRDAQRLAHLGSWERDLVTDEEQWSDEYFRIFGYEPGEIESTFDAFTERIHPDDRERVLSAVDDALAGKRPYDNEYRMVRRDGKTRVLHVQAEVLRDDAGQPVRFVGTTHDITARKRAEDEIRQRAAELEALRQVVLDISAELELETLLATLAARAIELLEAKSGGIYLYHPERDTLEWTISVGPGQPPPGHTLKRGQGVGGRVWDSGKALWVDNYSEWEGRAAFLDEFNVAAVLGVPVRRGSEFLGVLTAHRDTPHTFSERDAHLLGLFADHAALAIRNAQLFEAEQRERALANAMQNAVHALARSVQRQDTLQTILEELRTIVDFDSAAVMMVNQHNLCVVAVQGLSDESDLKDTLFAYEDIPQIKAAIVSGSPLAIPDVQAYPDWDDQAMHGMDSVKSWLGAPLIAWDVMVGFLSLGSQQPGKYGSREAHLLEAFGNHAALALEHATIIDELQAKLSALQEAQARLLRTERLSIAGELAAGVAHEINNPLAAIRVQTHLLGKRLDPERQAVHRSVEIIDEAAGRASAVVKRLLDLARPIPYRMEPLDVNVSIQKVLRLIRPQVEPAIHLVVDLSPDLPPLQGSTEHLESLWMNLLVNARDALEASQGDVIEVKSMLEADAIVVTIRDNGPGIPAADLERVFDPFFTTKGYQEGTGLGLSLCRDIVQQHAGTIQVTSEEGLGATFTVVLPLKGRKPIGMS